VELVDYVINSGQSDAPAQRVAGTQIFSGRASLIRSNNGTPRTLTVDGNLVENNFDAAVRIVEQVLRAEEWAYAHPDETRQFLARESNSSEYWRWKRGEHATSLRETG
jgi:ABC-type nitrate/sulfonate/bicarbonate transport system substrate-binding protein